MMTERRNRPRTAHQEFVRDGRPIPQAADIRQFYEALLASLEIKSATRSLRTILVTSSLPEEGKTTVTLGLAWAAMSAGKRPLVVDADLRRPRIHELLELDNSAGVSDLLSASHEPIDLMPTVLRTLPGPDGTEDRLGVITSGRPSEGVAIPSLVQRLVPALDIGAKHYDLVLIDSPPILAVSDALLIAAAADGVMLVLKAGATRAYDAQRARDRLRETNCNLLGVVMTHFVAQAHGDSYLPYHSYYAG
jgi:capsular exopolysaccharide synthesis family protein